MKFKFGLFGGVREDFVEIDFLFVVYSFYDKKVPTTLRFSFPLQSPKWDGNNVSFGFVLFSGYNIHVNKNSFKKSSVKEDKKANSFIKKQQQQQQKINNKSQIAESGYLPSVVKENLKSIKRTIVWKLKKKWNKKTCNVT